MKAAATQPPITLKIPRKGPKQIERARALLAALDRTYPHATCRLDWTAPHELLVATILSAQATDESVNAATPALFREFPRPADYAAATPDRIAPFIRTIGLARAEAKLSLCNLAYNFNRLIFHERRESMG
jgi:endonuclease-3